MTHKISFEGIGGQLATFYAGEGVLPGQVVKLSGDATVAPCAAGERFFAVAVNVREAAAAVQVGGFLRLPCSDSAVTVGYVNLTADGSGGVKKTSTASGSTDKGQECLVVRKESDAVTALLL